MSALSPFVRTILVPAILVSILVSTLRANGDVVRVRTSKGGPAVFRGQVLDATGLWLRIRTDDGRERSFAIEKIVDIQTDYDARQVQADAATDAGRFEEALKLYRQVLAAEKRGWVRRRITARMVRCHAGLGHTIEAGEAFLSLARDEPGPADFALMPLAWVSRMPPPELERSARAWIEMGPLPPAVLLGASHLLATERPRALARLKSLVVESDGPAAQLAAAQIWRTEVVMADEQRVSAWRQAIDRMPDPIRAGPSFVLGQALARLGRHEEAALAMLRVPILYPEQRDLAAESLWEAGHALEALDRPHQAARLYRELLDAHPDARHTSEARSRWEKMLGEKEKP